MITAHYYRFDEAVEHTRKAIALDRENFRAVADLGQQLMRTGDERNARRNLETAFRIDKWDVQTYNLLELLDNLEPFDTINEGEHGDPAGAGRIAGDEELRAACWRSEALDALSKRWEFTPKGPILIEMFPRTTTSRCARSACRACSARSAPASAASSRSIRRRRASPARSTGARRSGTRWRT